MFVPGEICNISFWVIESRSEDIVHTIAHLELQRYSLRELLIVSSVWHYVHFI